MTASDLLDASFKGLPLHAAVTLDDLGSQGWNIRRGDTSTPVAVLRDAALDANLDVMRRFCATAGVSIAPHAKTTMSPQLIARQLAAGVWGLTAALPAQVRMLWSFGACRVLMANELTDPAALRWLARELAAHPERELLCYVDSLDGVRLAEQAFAEADTVLPVLIELGHAAGRTGVRDRETALAVAEAAAAAPHLAVAGVAGYEGTIGHDRTPETIARVDAFLTDLRDLAAALADRGLFAPDREPIASAGGSSFFERVAQILGPLTADGIRVVLRSGCYLTHDNGQYATLTPSTRPEWTLPPFQAALEVWTRVVSRPEPGLALLNAGRRDLSHDAGLPIPLTAWRDTTDTAIDLDEGAHISALSDQHTFLRIDPDSPLAVGDLVALGVSHPCMTLDRWRLFLLVNEDYDVIGGARTYF
ncbi:alanine racemase domain protein [Catenulispora acidiphila DSM 44928]|uniref:Alanine racemase domain protein n=1 Tax=Catenulispora acidiphila (strain DSM 44928 / JCM 14897 / NBRC 102108 / NRRL B-24433 / ID139908) TaxID=479433 RepID=C7PW11_CATAD|nr:alanine racemase [Catenulispora acidiphila]ACU71403.1 alanine racemase domain protein [Catenulispora acidiphila DSM 44928]